MKTNAIQYGIQYVKRFIPREILRLAFKSDEEVINKYSTVDDRIRRLVVEPIVKLDLNCTGGMNMEVELRNCSIRKEDTKTFIVKVPKYLTNNKSIIAVMNIILATTPFSLRYRTLARSANPLTQYATKTFNSVDSIKAITTSRLEIIGDNLILVYEPSMLLSNGVMNVDVENDGNLENLQSRYYPWFGKLLLNAVKNYIYVNKIVQLDVGEVYGGHEINTIKEIVESYSEAGDEYTRMIDEEWSKISVLNNPRRVNKYIRLITGSNT